MVTKNLMRDLHGIIEEALTRKVNAPAPAAYLAPALPAPRSAAPDPASDGDGDPESAPPPADSLD